VCNVIADSMYQSYETIATAVSWSGVISMCTMSLSATWMICPQCACVWMKRAR
jgi:hypothetical protein